MDQPLCFLYDHKTDVLSITCGHPIYTDSVALDENVILHVEPTTQRIVGFAIVDFIKRFANTETPACIPLSATFERRRRTKTRQTRRATRRG